MFYLVKRKQKYSWKDKNTHHWNWMNRTRRYRRQQRPESKDRQNQRCPTLWVYRALSLLEFETLSLSLFLCFSHRKTAFLHRKPLYFLSGGLSPIGSGWVPASSSISSLKSSNSLVSFPRGQNLIFLLLYKVKQKCLFFGFQIRVFVFSFSFSWILIVFVYEIKTKLKKSWVEEADLVLSAVVE